MKDLDKRSEFDDEWQDAFADAEAEPSGDVWVKVDAFLANGEAKKYKNRAFYYKLVAAASVVVAIGFGLSSLLDGKYGETEALTDTNQTESRERELMTERKKNKEERETLAEAETAEEEGTLTDENIADVRAENEDSGERDNASAQSGGAESSDQAPERSVDPVAAENVGIADSRNGAEELEQPIQSVNPIYMSTGDEDENRFAGLQEVDSRGKSKKGAASGSRMIAFAEKNRANELENDLLSQKTEINKVTDLSDFIKDEPEEARVFWAGLSVGTGTFDPDYTADGSGLPNQDGFFALAQEGHGVTRWNSAHYDYSNHGGAPLNVANPENKKAVPSVVDNESQSGLSYSMGLNFGVKVTKKWLVQSGVFYAKHVTSSSTGTVSVDAENSNVAYPIHISNLMDARANFSNILYQVNVDIYNNFEFISLPLKAGYMLVDRKKIDLLLSGGVTSDFFINNKIKDEGLGLQEVNVKPGTDSPYRNVLFNGIVSAELKYSLNDGRYSLYIEPSYRIALNSFTKSDYVFTSRPRSFDVGVGIKYNFY